MSQRVRLSQQLAARFEAQLHEDWLRRVEAAAALALTEAERARTAQARGSRRRSQYARVARRFRNELVRVAVAVGVPARQVAAAGMMHETNVSLIRRGLR